MILQEQELLEQKRASAGGGGAGGAGGAGGVGGGGAGGGAAGEAGSESSQGDQTADAGEATGDSPNAPTGSGRVPGRQDDDSELQERVPADIPDGRDDDIVARQLREAAMNEEDPELRERLWDEYRRYKGIRTKGNS